MCHDNIFEKISVSFQSFTDTVLLKVTNADLRAAEGEGPNIHNSFFKKSCRLISAKCSQTFFNGCLFAAACGPPLW